jgi:predicted RNase H-like HicB family nuclease
VLFFTIMAEHYHVDAVWDPEAAVWVATSDDVPGLATEAPTLEELTRKLHVMIPELLDANGLLTDGAADRISFELTGHRREMVTVAS